MKLKLALLLAVVAVFAVNAQRFGHKGENKTYTSNETLALLVDQGVITRAEAERAQLDLNKPHLKTKYSDEVYSGHASEENPIYY